MLQDPANRVLRFGEGQAPAWQPSQCRLEPDPRVRQAKRELRSFYYLAPHFAAIHPLTADGPPECTALFANSFRSLQFELTYDVPSYSAWLEQQDLADAYRYYADQLCLLQWRQPGGRWVLKSPAHMFGLDALLATFLDACIVQTHRDPLKVLASFCSLAAVLRGVTSDRAVPRQIGRQFAAKWATGLERALAVRGGAGEQRFCDVHFEELVSDLLGVVRKIYARFGLPFDTTVEGRMRQALAENPRDKHGMHRYTLRQLDLDPLDEARRFAGTLRLDFLAVGLENGCFVDRVFIGRDEIHHPPVRAFLEVMDQLVHMLRRPLAGNDTHDPTVLRIKSHMIPVVALQGVAGIVGVTGFLFLAHEGPLFVELHLPGLRGKKPRTRRVSFWRAHPPADCSARPCSYSLPPADWSCARHSLRRYGPRPRRYPSPAACASKNGVPLRSEKRVLQVAQCNIRRS